MAEDTQTPEIRQKKGNLRALILGLVGAALCGGGAFYTVYSGHLFKAENDDTADKASQSVADLPEIAFVQLAPLLVTLSQGQQIQQLRFEGYLEVNPEHAEEVDALMPRIMDVLNGYLRAIEAHDITEPAAMLRIRGQMLRRIQIVTGEGRVRDLLITTFLVT